MIKFRYPDRLISSMNDQKLIPFVGAGISKKSLPNHFPTWKELITSMNLIAFQKNAISAREKNEIALLVKSNRLTFAMDELRGALSAEDYEDLLADKFEYIDPNSADLTTQKLLLKIAGKFIVTTNYDRLIEDAYARTFKKSPTSVTFDQAATIQHSIQDHRSSKEPIIFKIHGDIKSKQSLILSERDYRTLLYDQQTYETVITSMFMNNVFLFVGFSLDDREILFHLERLRHRFNYVNHSHYALIARNSLTRTEIKQFKELYGVEIIEFDKSNSYIEIDKFLTGALRRKI